MRPNAASLKVPQRRQGLIIVLQAPHNTAKEGESRPIPVYIPMLLLNSIA